VIARALTGVVLLAAVVVATGVRGSDAALTATSSNPGNAITAAASFNFRVASGSFTGNGTAGRAITGLGFTPDLVIVKGNTTQLAVARTSTMTGDATKPLATAVAPGTGQITSLDSAGFTLGTNARVNASGTAYTWTALGAAKGTMKVGTYTGTGSASQAVTGVGFAPSLVLVLPASTAAASLRGTGMTSAFHLDSDTGQATEITALGSDGFTAGSTLNASSVAYHYVAWTNKAGLVATGTYTGDNTNNRAVSAGLAPSYVLLRATNATAHAAVHRPTAVTGSSSLRFNAAANDTNAITGMGTTGFQVSKSTDANALATPYFYAAFADGGP
jgi:hypothetical protein